MLQMPLNTSRIDRMRKLYWTDDPAYDVTVRIAVVFLRKLRKLHYCSADCVASAPPPPPPQQQQHQQHQHQQPANSITNSTRISFRLHYIEWQLQEREKEDYVDLDHYQSLKVRMLSGTLLLPGYSKKKQQQQAAQLNNRLQDLLAQPGNDVCSDCSEARPTWAFVLSNPVEAGGAALGGFCCSGCSKHLVDLGSDVCVVKSAKTVEGGDCKYSFRIKFI